MKKLTIVLFYLIFLLAFAFSAYAGLLLGGGIEGGAEDCTWDLLNEDCSDFSYPWSDNDTDTGVSEISPAGQFRMDTNTGAAGSAVAKRLADIGNYPNQFTVAIRLYHDDIGLDAGTDYFQFRCCQADERLKVKFCSDGLKISDTGSGETEVGTDIVKEGASKDWQEWYFLVTFGTTGAGTCDVHQKNDSTSPTTWTLVGEDIPCSDEGSYTDGETQMSQAGFTTDDMVTHIDYIKVATGLCPPTGINPPTVTTQAVDGIHDASATGHGNITATGGENATNRCVVWDTAQYPTYGEDSSNCSGVGSYGTGAFSLQMTELSSNTTYWVRAYAPNSGGDGYGDQVEYNTTGSPPAGCSHYVDTGGNDSTGNGTSGNPWLTVVHTLSQSSWGELVCCNDGTYDEGQLIVPCGVSLTSTSANASKVTIQPNTNMSNLQPFLKLETSSPNSDGNQTISYLKINGHTASYSCCLAISVKNRNNVKIHHNYIYDFYSGLSSSYGAHGIAARTSGTPPSGVWPDDPGLPGNDTALDAVWPANPVKNLEIDHNEIVNCGRDDDSLVPYGGIWAYNLKDSSIHDNEMDNTDNCGQCIYSTPAFFDNVDIYNNTLRMANLGTPERSNYIIELWYFKGGCKIYGNDVDSGFSLPIGKETKVYDNIINVPGSHQREGYGIEFTCQTFSEAYCNYISGARSGIFLGLDGNQASRHFILKETIVKNNVIVNLLRAGIKVICTGTGERWVNDFKIYNNVIDSNVNSVYALLPIVQSNAGVINDIEVKNNILINGAGYPGKTGGTVSNPEIENNLFWNNPNNFWVGGGDVNTITENPDINGTGDKPGPWYYLQSVSPAIDAGVNTTITDDYWGTARPIDGDGNGTAEYDIGAHEYSP